MEARLAPGEIRDVQLGLLDDFAAFADHYGLTWFLYAGTLLGAARHQGYIPWDDDLDVAMPREDYRRLLALMKADPMAEADLGAPGDKGYPFPFAKLSRRGTRLREEAFERFPDLGVNIDIFPVDTWPSDPKWERSQRRIQSRLEALTWLQMIPPGWGRNPPRRAAITVARAVVRSLPFGMFGRMADEMARGYTGDRAGVIVWGVRDVVPWSNLLPTTTLPFEGRMLPVPGRWDEVLTSIYGAWGTPPPESERGDRHGVAAWITRGT